MPDAEEEGAEKFAGSNELFGGGDSEEESDEDDLPEEEASSNEQESKSSTEPAAEIEEDDEGGSGDESSSTATTSSSGTEDSTSESSGGGLSAPSLGDNSDDSDSGKGPDEVTASPEIFSSVEDRSDFEAPSPFDGASMPYIVQRMLAGESIRFGRSEKKMLYQPETLQTEKAALQHTDEHEFPGTEVQVSDFREALILAGLKNLDDAVDILDHWGYGMADQ